MSQGDTEEALEMIRGAQRLWLQVALEDGDPIPQPAAGEHSFTGKFNVRVTRDLHRALVQRADEQGISLNLFVATALASVAGVPYSRKPRSGASARSVTREEGQTI